MLRLLAVGRLLPLSFLSFPSTTTASAVRILRRPALHPRGGFFRIRYFASIPLPSDGVKMEELFQKMEREGVPRCEEPSEAVTGKGEKERALPELSAQEFRIYNRMAEHMDMFVRFAPSPSPSASPLSSDRVSSSRTAREFPPDLEPPVRRMRFGQTASRHEYPRLPLRRRTVLPSPHYPSHDRRASHLSNAREKNAGV